MKKVAITIDDLPINSMFTGYEHIKYVINQLITHLLANDAPATGFVIERGLYQDNELSQQLVDLLRKWVDSGYDLANHTFSHKSYRDVEIDDYLTDILMGDTVMRELLSVVSKRVKYFRSPYLDTGDSVQKRLALDGFLDTHGYIMAPVTIDGWDWKFNISYESALDANDRQAADRIAGDYIDYTRASFVYREYQAVDLFGYEIPQVLLVHANTINADHFHALLQMIRGQNYKFVSLEEALSDNSYESTDRCCERNGQSWLDRWAFSIGPGKRTCDNYFPEPPDYINIIKGNAEA